MAIHSESKDGILSIFLLDARMLDETQLEQLSRDLIEELEKTTEERVILDFTRVQFMSSAMLGKLVQLQKKCKEFKVKMKLCSIAPEIREVFKITNLDKVFDIEKDQASARKAFLKKGFF